MKVLDNNTTNLFLDMLDAGLVPKESVTELVLKLHVNDVIVRRKYWEAVYADDRFEGHNAWIGPHCYFFTRNELGQLLKQTRKGRPVTLSVMNFSGMAPTTKKNLYVPR